MLSSFVVVFLKEIKGIKLKWFNFKFKINLTPEIQFVCWHQVYKKYAISETIELIEPNIFLYVHCMSPLTSLCSLCWLEIQGCFHVTWENKFWFYWAIYCPLQDIFVDISVWKQVSQGLINVWANMGHGLRDPQHICHIAI